MSELFKEIVETVAKKGGKIEEASDRVMEALGGMKVGLAAEVINDICEEAEGPVNRGHFREALGTDWFTSIVMDKAHNSLMKGFGMVETHWQKVCEVVSVDDIKTHYVTAFSGAPTLPTKTEHKGFEELLMKDRAENYTPDEHGRIFSLSKAVKLNDAIKAFDKWNIEEGKAGAKTIDYKVFYTNMDANPTMSDSNSLFDSAGGTTHNNAPNAIGVLDKGAILLAIQTLLAQTGLNSEELGLKPRYLCCNDGLAPVAYDLVSTVVKNYGASASAAEPNIYGSQGRYPIEVIGSPFIVSGSNLDYYLLADPSTGPLFEIGFLDGKQTPELLQEMPGTGANFTHNEYRFRSYMCFGVTALEWRTMVFCDSSDTV